MELGVEKDKGLVYEGSGHWGHAIWPSPKLVPAAFTSSMNDKLAPSEGKLNPNEYVFREESYDPVSRVRRGYFYDVSGSQPMLWHVSPHPAIDHEKNEMSEHGTLEKRLYTLSVPYIPNILKEIEGQPLVLLGSGESYTLWAITSVEKGISAGELVTLRVRQSFGALPVLESLAIPEQGRELVKDAISTLEEDLHRAGPESVVDRARETTAVILSVYLQDKDAAPKEKELGKLINVFVDLEKNNKQVISSAATITRIFHSRGKHSVQDKMPIRSLVEQDAELAVNCVGVMLSDLGWANW